MAASKSLRELIQEEREREATDRAIFEHDRTERVKRSMAKLTPKDAYGVIVGEYLGQPSDYHLARLASAYKQANPHVAWEEIFDAFKYRPDRLKSMASSIYDYHRIMRGDLGQRVMLGFPQLDAYLRGIRPGQVCGFMARAGVGKTTFACNVIVNLYSMAEHPPVLFFSMEMPSAEIAARLFIIDRKMLPTKVEEYFTFSANAPLVAEWALKYHDLVLVDEASLNLNEMSRLHDEACAYLGRHIPLIIIDYMGLISGKGGSNYERASYVAQGLKRLAKEKNAAVLVIIQTSREGGTGRDRVDMKMARDSGQIEEACDFLLGAWRPSLGEEDPEGDGEFKMAVLKNRHGRSGDVDMVLDFSHLRITEVG